MDLRTRLGRLRTESGAPDGPARLSARNGHGSAADGEQAIAVRTGGRVLAPGVVVVERIEAVSATGAGPLCISGLPELQGMGGTEWIYLDTETTGLSGGTGNLAFMIGVARLEKDGTAQLRQYLLTGFAGEREMLRDLHRWCGEAAGFVSYNGKCFDLPLIAARCRMNRLDASWTQRDHLDLLHTVRRAFRDAWPDCRLQTAERFLLDFQREDDLPGHMAPLAWQAWLGGGDDGLLRGVLRHNAQDVLSMIHLHRSLVDVYASGRQAGCDRVRLARAWYNAGQDGHAVALLERAVAPSVRERLALADLYRRLGRWNAAEAAWRPLAEQGNVEAAESLSKYYEHRCRDFHAALAMAVRLDASKHARRLARLRAKLGRDLALPLERPTVDSRIDAG